MRYTKADVVLEIVENIFNQEDLAIVDRIGRVTGIDLHKLPEEFLNEMIETDEFPKEVFEVTGALGHIVKSAQGLGQAALTHGTKLASQAGHHIATGASQVASLASAHPVAAGVIGAGALALGARAALRARRANKSNAGRAF